MSFGFIDFLATPPAFEGGPLVAVPEGLLAVEGLIEAIDLVSKFLLGGALVLDNLGILDYGTFFPLFACY